MSCINGDAAVAAAKRRGKRQSSVTATTTTPIPESGVYLAEQGLPNPHETVYKPRQRRQNRQLRALQQQPRLPAAWPYTTVQPQSCVQIAAEQLIALATQQEQELTEYNKRLRTMEDRVRILVNTASTMMTETHNLTALRDRLEKAHQDLCASMCTVAHPRYGQHAPGGLICEASCDEEQRYMLQQQQHYQSPSDQANVAGQCSEEECAMMNYGQPVQQQPPQHVVSSDPNYIPFSMGFYDKTSSNVHCGQKPPQTILSTAAQLLRTSCNT